MTEQKKKVLASTAFEIQILNYFQKLRNALLKEIKSTQLIKRTFTEIYNFTGSFFQSVLKIENVEKKI